MNRYFVKIFMIAVGVASIVQTSAVGACRLPGFERWEAKDKEGVSTTIQICIRTAPAKDPKNDDEKYFGVMWIEYWDKKTEKWDNIDVFYREERSQEEACAALRKDAEEFVRKSYTNVTKIYSDWEK